MGDGWEYPVASQQTTQSPNMNSLTVRGPSKDTMPKPENASPAQSGKEEQ
jgi:hypothetical protein